MVQGTRDCPVTGSLRELERRFPAVVILGARQVGKTTLACCSFSLRPYLDCEDPATSVVMSDDARLVLASGEQGGLVLDKPQAVARVFNAIQGLIDEARRRKGGGWTDGRPWRARGGTER